jgi:hypothetical protein
MLEGERAEEGKEDGLDLEEGESVADTGTGSTDEGGLSTVRDVERVGLVLGGFRGEPPFRSEEMITKEAKRDYRSANDPEQSKRRKGKGDGSM